MTYRDEVLADSPLAFWEFEETSGSTFTDSVSGYVFNKTDSPLLNQAGIKGRPSIYFDGVNDALSNTGFPAFIDTAFTVEMWVKYPTQTMDYPTFLRRDGGGGAFLMRTRGPGAGVRVHMMEAYTNGQTVMDGVTTHDNAWHHVVFVNSGNVTTLYVDNVAKVNRTGSVGTATNTGTIYLGRGDGATEYFKGNIAQVSIYPSALNSTRIAAHYNAADSSGAVAAYRGWGRRINPALTGGRWA